MTQDTAGNSASVFYYNIKVEEVDAFNAISGMAAGMKRESYERKLLGCVRVYRSRREGWREGGREGAFGFFLFDGGQGVWGIGFGGGRGGGCIDGAVDRSRPFLQLTPCHVISWTVLFVSWYSLSPVLLLAAFFLALTFPPHLLL